MFSGSQGSGKYKTWSDLELVCLLAREPWNNAVWKEFIARFGKPIKEAVAWTCLRLNFREGLSQVEDLVQDVYNRLLENHGANLKSINENPKAFLRTLAINITKNKFRSSLAQKNNPEGGIISGDQALPERHLSEHRMNEFWETIPAAVETTPTDLMEEIDECLDHILLHHRNSQRNRAIFRLYLYQELSAEEIAAMQGFDLSKHRIDNLLNSMMKALRGCIGAKGFGPRKQLKNMGKLD